MKHAEKLEAWPVWQLLTIAHEKYQVVEIMFLLAVAQNICILLRFSSLQWNVDFFQYIFGLCQICCSGTVFARHAIHQSFKGISVSLFTNDPQLVFLTIASCFSFLGLFWSPLFFSFHLLDIANKSQVLQNVFLAVTTNLDSLLLTALFTLIVIWIYAVYGFATYSDYFRAFDDPTDADGGEAVMDLCTDIYVCYLNAVSTGLRSGDLGGLMQMVPSEDAHFQGMMFYQFSYWVIIITVMLNLIFGIIIDTFSELRTTHASNKAQMENTCFISGIDRFTLDTKGGGFERHIKHDQNMWMYLYMLCYLWDKEETEYNGWEQWVRDRLDKKEVDFLPRNKAVALSALMAAEEADANAQRQNVEDIKTNVDKLTALVKSSSEKMDEKKNKDEKRDRKDYAEAAAPSGASTDLARELARDSRDQARDMQNNMSDMNDSLLTQNQELKAQMAAMKAQQDEMQRTLQELVTKMTTEPSSPRQPRAPSPRAAPPPSFVPAASSSSAATVPAGPASARRPSDVKALRSRFEVPGSSQEGEAPAKTLQKRPTKFEL